MSDGDDATRGHDAPSSAAPRTDAAPAKIDEKSGEFLFFDYGMAPPFMRFRGRGRESDRFSKHVAGVASGAGGVELGRGPAWWGASWSA